MSALLPCPSCADLVSDATETCDSCGRRLVPSEKELIELRRERPRFVVSSVTGYPISGYANTHATLYSVLDTANCFRIVKSFKGYRQAKPKAEAFALKLNREYAE